MFEFYGWLVLAGLAGGLLAGLLGIGGGLIFILVLPWALARIGVGEAALPSFVIANSLFATLLSALSSLVSHLRRRPGRLADMFWVGVPAVVVATISLAFLVARPWFSPCVFNSILVGILVYLLARNLVSYLQNLPDAAQVPPQRPGLLAGVGTLSGLVSSLTGLGGGIIVVPALRQFGKYPTQAANFVSTGTIAMASASTLLVSGFQDSGVTLDAPHLGRIVFPVILPLAVGVIAAAPFGVKLSRRLATRTVLLLFSAFVLVVLAKKTIEVVGDCF